MTELAKKTCVACEGGVPRLTRAEAEHFRKETPEWTLSEDAARLSRRFAFKDFAKALAFVNAVGKLAEEEWHHPDIAFGWGRVEITVATHAVRGLTENDFILAAKIDLLPAA